MPPDGRFRCPGRTGDPEFRKRPPYAGVDPAQRGGRTHRRGPGGCRARVAPDTPAATARRGAAAAQGDGPERRFEAEDRFERRGAPDQPGTTRPWSRGESLLRSVKSRVNTA